MDRYSMTGRRRIVAWVGLLGGLVAVVAPSCSEDEDSGGSGAAGASVPTVPCNEDPWQCADGTTCWINDDQSGFECLPSGSATSGSDCHNYVGAPTCADDLVCYQLAGATQGICSEWCDPASGHDCPDGRACHTLVFQTSGGELQAHVCEPAGGSGGAGATGGSGGSGGSTGGSGGATGGSGGQGGATGGSGGQGG